MLCPSHDRPTANGQQKALWLLTNKAPAPAPLHSGAAQALALGGTCGVRVALVAKDPVLSWL